MITYLLLNIVFMLTAIFFLPKNITKVTRAWWITLLAVLFLTAVFDPIIIALDIVAYDSSKILGLRLFGAPIEDFFYAVYSVIIVPLVWNKLGEHSE